MHLLPIVASALFVVVSYAHPGHDHEKELRVRREFLAVQNNNMNHCASLHEASGLRTRAIERRAELAYKLSRQVHGTSIDISTF